MTTHVVTNFSQAYYGTMQQYHFLESYSQLRDVQKTAFVLDYKPEFLAWLKETFPSVNFIGKDKKTYKLQEQLADVPSLQYGEFIDDVPGLQDNDYVFFVDADATVQRQFTKDELETFACKPNLTFLTMNARGGHSLAEELMVLEQNPKFDDLFKEFGNIEGLVCFNTGLIGNSPPNWRRARDYYIANFPRWHKLITHKAAVQWFESWMYQTQGFELFDPHSEFVKNIHSHCHEATAIQFFGVKHDADGYLVRQTTYEPLAGQTVPVLFAHAHLHPQWQHLLAP